MLKGNCIIAQSGGPTSVINASAAGAIFEALNQDVIQNVYAANNGIVGVLQEELFDLKEENPKELEYLKTSPSSALGSCRYKLKGFDEDPSDYIQIFKIFQAHNIRYFFYIGGNDSMDTVAKLSAYADQINYDIRILGIPKTIDNDLVGTDHCPGFGSAAKYIATSILEASMDAAVYKNDIVTIIEVMGRNAGWLAAAGALARNSGNEVPDLIYLPEFPFDFDQFKKDVEKVRAQKGKVMIVVSEGIKDQNGNYVEHIESENHDIFGHAQLGGVGNTLKRFIQKHIINRVKVVELNILQRCAMHMTSKTDLDEAFLAGKNAVQYAIEGHSGYMVAFKRTVENSYSCETQLLQISEIANQEKEVPLEWINPDGNFVTKECINYMSPLIQGEVSVPMENGIPRYVRLKKVFIPKKCQ